MAYRKQIMPLINRFCLINPIRHTLLFDMSQGIQAHQSAIPEKLELNVNLAFDVSLAVKLSISKIQFNLYRLQQ